MSSSRISPWSALVVAVVAVGGLWLGTRLPGSVADAAAGEQADGASAGVVALRVRTTEGAELALNAVTAPTVVMISSETCGYCEAALREMGRVAAGRPLGGLRYVTLEGAEAGVPMLRAANVVGAMLAGPVTAAAASLFTFQIRGTPTFVALDSAGRVTATMIGYLGARELRPWIDVMLGEAARPR